MQEEGAAAVEQLHRDGLTHGGLLGLALAPGAGVALAAADRPSAGLSPGAAPAGLVALATGRPGAVVATVEEAFRPRWVIWSNDPAAALASSGVRIATCWDIAAAHRLLAGGWRADPARAWAQVQGLEPSSIPEVGAPDLFSAADDPATPIGPDGHLDPGWVHRGSPADPARLSRWARLALTVAGRQQAALPGRAGATARSESAAELLCVELSADGLPMSRPAAEAILAAAIGPRPRSEAEAAQGRAQRDAAVLRHAPPGGGTDLRSPAQVRELLARIGVAVPDTRAWRLRALAGAHPLIGALLVWRKAERLATTYGYDWLDEHLGTDGRLRGSWTGSDGAAGRMTASAGLHNMPALMRSAVLAEPGQIFIRADLGQIEPRVLAAVSGDRALARACVAADLYAPVAAQLGVDRDTAKIAVLGAMCGQTTGHGAQALRRLTSAYPVAMSYLAEADRAGRAGRDLRTYGGRRIVLGPAAATDPPGRSAARGSYARNALVQGAAAELFKVWAVTVRARGARWGAQIVLCLHDELLVQAPLEHGPAVARLLDDCLQEAVAGWLPGAPVRFLADTSVITRWADAKGNSPTVDEERRTGTQVRMRPGDLA